MELTKSMMYLSWFLRIVAAVILLQTLFFKFTGAAESVYIFSTLGMEPWGRIGSGVAELIASILLLMPGTVVYGDEAAGRGDAALDDAQLRFNPRVCGGGRQGGSH